jgi:hypothetical protein
MTAHEIAAYLLENLKHGINLSLQMIQRLFKMTQAAFQK